mmetsp:Transcript_5256/g.5374  ORF Transcript_5256/g.5374 Transcript_5256/m.5374 type:complete len:121 (+) Transcript_5256:1165-1527(+)
MRHLAVYLLLVLGGNSSPTAEDITNVLSQVGIEVDEERVNSLISELEGKDLSELIAEGREKLFVGGSGAPAAGAAAPVSGGAAPAAEEKAAPAAKPKEEEVDALEGGMDMFGGGGGGGDY